LRSWNKSELFAQEKILSSQCATRRGKEHEETEEIAGDPEQRVEAVCQQLKDGAQHERLTLHVTRRCAAGNWSGTEFLRTTAADAWFWADPTNDLIFVGMTQRMFGAGWPNVSGLSRPPVYAALVDPKR